LAATLLVIVAVTPVCSEVKIACSANQIGPAPSSNVHPAPGVLYDAKAEVFPPIANTASLAYDVLNAGDETGVVPTVNALADAAESNPIGPPRITHPAIHGYVLGEPDVGKVTVTVNVPPTATEEQRKNCGYSPVMVLDVNDGAAAT
jgi:hypothetical protein